MLLERRRFVVKERVSLLKLADIYDVLDPETGQALGEVRDEPTSLARFARLLVSKTFLATTINLYEAGSSRPLVSLNKRPGFLRTTVIVTGTGGAALGSFRSKAISLGGGFFVFDASGQTVAEIKGDWRAGTSNSSTPRVASSVPSPKSGPASAKSSSPPPTRT